MKMFLPLVFAMVSATIKPAFPASANQVSQSGIIWTFDKAYEVGQFVTGDWWVSGPATVSSVSPAPTPTRNGTCVNPQGGRQGYDDRASFSTADRVSFPYILQPGQSMVSSISKADGPDYKNIGVLKSQAVLTAVSIAPPAGTFRPSYAGTYKKYFSISQIRSEILPNLSKPSSAPLGADLIKASRGPRIDHLCDWTIQYGCAEDQWYDISGGSQPCYGRSVATFVSDAALYVMLNTADRNQIVQNMVQLGIDNYGVLKAGGKWPGNGGHFSGRKWPVVFAAIMLNDSAMLKVGTDYGADGNFGEDDQTYYGVNNKVLWGWDCGGGQGSYFPSCSGSGAKDCRDPAGLVDGCSDYRSCCTVPFWIGEMLSVLILNAKTIWNHNAFFDFVDRWMAGDLSDASGAQDKFVTAMWDLYRNNLPAPVLPAIPVRPPQATIYRSVKISMDGSVRFIGDKNNRKLLLYDLYGRKTDRVSGSGCFLIKNAGNAAAQIVVAP